MRKEKNGGKKDEKPLDLSRDIRQIMERQSPHTEPDQEVIALLENLLMRAKSGQTVELAGYAGTNTGTQFFIFAEGCSPESVVEKLQELLVRIYCCPSKPCAMQEDPDRPSEMPSAAVRA